MPLNKETKASVWKKKSNYCIHMKKLKYLLGYHIIMQNDIL